MDRLGLLVCVLAAVGCFSDPSEDAEEASSGPQGSSGDGPAVSSSGSTGMASTTGAEGSASSGGGTDTSDTTGTDTSGTADPVCGDGEVSEGEDCDDGNDNDGDGCSQCRTSGTRLWTYSQGNDSDSESVSDLAVDAEGFILAAGTIGDATASASEGWVAKLDPAGTLVWERNPLPSDGARADGFAALTLGPRGSVIAAGQEFNETTGVFERAIVGFGPTGDPLFQHLDGHTVDDAPQPLGAFGITTTPMGQLITSGYRFAGPIDGDAYVELHDPQGVPTELLLVEGDEPLELAATGWRSTRRGNRIRSTLFTPNAAEVVAWDGEPGAEPSWRRSIAGAVGNPFADLLEPMPVAIEGDGTTVVCVAIDGGSGTQLLLARFNTEGMPLNQINIQPDRGDAVCGGLSAAENGDLLLAWSEVFDISNSAFWVTRTGVSDGQVRWSVALEEGVAGAARGLAVAEGIEGEVIAGGTLNLSPGDRDLYIAALVP